uniref:Transmembrane protein 267 n=1 Tax=Timema genevievae TaxID=629358 RepID=A0A7R9PGL9_TIMGE|nr:unnamed protein product [Timema genevievae]
MCPNFPLRTASYYLFSTFNDPLKMLHKGSTLSEKIAILDKIKSQLPNISHHQLAEIIKLPKSIISRLLQQQEKLREEWTLRTLCDQRPLFHCISIVLAICAVLIMLSQTSGSPILVQSSWLVTTAALGHLIRDAAQNGFWMCPLEPAPPLPYCVYITMICALPYVIRLERVAKPQKHAFHNEGIQPEEELAKRGFSIYKGPGKVRSVSPFVWRESGKTALSTPNQDLNLNLPVIDSIVYCECDTLDNVVTERAHSVRQGLIGAEWVEFVLLNVGIRVYLYHHQSLTSQKGHSVWRMRSEIRHTIWKLDYSVTTISEANDENCSD